MKIQVFLNMEPFRFLSIFKSKKRRIPGNLNIRNGIVITNFFPSRYVNLRVVVKLFLASTHIDSLTATGVSHLMLSESPQQ